MPTKDAKAARPFAVNLDDVPTERDDGENCTWNTLISGDRTPSDELVLGVVNFPPHGDLRLHRHEPAEFYFGLSGDGIVIAGGNQFKISKGISMFIPGNVEHGVIAGEKGLSMLYGFAKDSYDEIVYKTS